MFVNIMYTERSVESKGMACSALFPVRSNYNNIPYFPDFLSQNLYSGGVECARGEVLAVRVPAGIGPGMKTY